ncbi:MAG: hypothetical protein GXY52_07015 [Chloroflexi bacterium]|nr:hypothetical protein [Chloroflexota bacterium]
MSKSTLEEQIAWYEDNYARPERPAKAPRPVSRDSEYGEADLDPLHEVGFETTYTPSRYERGYLLETLGPLYEQALISDVLAKVRGGKEATVYRCRAHPATGVEFLAAKVYRPRMFRSLRNDALYREGREILAQSGKVIAANELREMRAMRTKTRYGTLLSQASWLAHEYGALRTLSEAGADVPKPYASSEHAILMSYIGDAHLAAPNLTEVALTSGEARRLWERVVENVRIFMQHSLIHGDLSAYNILYWEGQIIIIDLPQVTSLLGNRSARMILRRDLLRTAEYFNTYGLGIDAERLSDLLWQEYLPSEAGTVAYGAD